MPVVCVNRPVRTVPRLWRSSDLCRVGRYVSDRDGIVAVIRCAFISTGRLPLLCDAAQAVTPVLLILRALLTIVGLIASSKAIEVLLSILGRSRLAKIPWLGWLSLWVIILYEVFIIVQNSIALFQHNLNQLIELLSLLVEVCDEK